MHSNEENPYQAARSLGQQLLWDAVLKLASDLLVTGGVEALSMRTLAKSVGCSTTVLYNLFGSKAGIVDALIAEGFARIREAQQAVLAQGGTATERLLALCLAYRRVALANQTHYQIMFGRISSDEMSDQSKHVALDALSPLVAMVEEACRDDGLKVDDPTDFAMALWATAHGFVTIEIAGMTLDPERAEAVFVAAIRRLLGL
ncbi:MAG: WHG domain-containing protein [Pleurocapsa minor GSE-CHR-MK-17-07R]|jgi:AcrR family transcriptional regulator|nr:WHG domain-containing protein [Pleurocapsa minor GSE-CHR-MK 17-07R]